MSATALLLRAVTETSAAQPTTSNGIDLVPAFNGSLVNNDLCTPTTCSLEYANLLYVPSFAGNLVYLIIFALLLSVHTIMGVAYRTWGFSIGMACGLILEIVGYAGRIGLHNNVFLFDYFIIYIVCLTIAPAFLSAAIYLCLSRLVMVYGPSIARFSPKTYTLTFVCCDIISLVLQAAGGGISATADGGTPEAQAGINTMIAGLAFQVVSLTVFVALSADFAMSVYRASRGQLNEAFVELRGRLAFSLFPYALALATITILIRCCFRVAELKDGFDGPLANNQTMFMIFEGPMIIVAGVALAICHPGICFGGSHGWQSANWTWRSNRAQGEYRVRVPTHRTKRELKPSSV